MYVSLIADYGNGDPAFAEVTQRLSMFLPSSQIYCLSVPPFSTLATGFWVAQLGLNPGPEERLIDHNCAPRQDDPEARQNNEGEGSSGWAAADGNSSVRWMELFLRGGNAWERFGKPRVNQLVTRIG